MSELNIDELVRVRDWAREELSKMERQGKQLEMMNLMMGAMNKVSKPAINKLVTGPNKAMESALHGLEKANREWPARYHEAIQKMEVALAEERRKTDLLRVWLSEVSG